ncbi:MAG: prepilin-type N-terminal cleavage/methylation domain-containing protein, partial [Holophagales bacterium]|nr:prepilin-type N-terminal cleavage/methylation domain-containing protein [Holophagales bacterium]
MPLPIWAARVPEAARRAFSLTEMLVVLLIVGILLGGLLTLFSRSTYIARTQSDLAVLQQSLRVAHGELSRYLRMAGSGGLPISWNTIPTGVTIDYTHVGSYPNGFAVRVENNVAEGTTIGGLPVVPGTDVLTVRGVFSTPVYYLGDGVNVGAMITGGQINGSPIFVS